MIISQNIENSENVIKKTEVGGGGFINFFLRENYWYGILGEIEEEGDSYGKSDLGRNEKVQIEFVSANPTGPLHIGHGRGAAIGDAMANILKTAGYNVVREYYINDVGVQMETLGKSVFLRYQQLHNSEVNFPSQYYQGKYIFDIAREIIDREKDNYLEAEENDAVGFFADFASRYILEGIKRDLADFAVEFDCWFSEKRLFLEEGVVSLIADLKSQGYVYEKDGALWFKSTDYGDDKDRVVVKANGDTTYFASDIAYHKNKFERGFTWVLNIWGADHHGYIPRMRSVIQALGRKEEALKVIMVQLVSLLRDGKPVTMSTRAGEFVTLKNVVDEVGKDASRYFFLMRRSDSHLDFDLELAKKQSEENPVYYVQYGHARISSILRFAREKKISPPKFSEINAELLNLPEEISIIKKLASFPELIAGCALSLEPHRITGYLNDLVSIFHGYYNKNRVISDDLPLSEARLFLVKAVRNVIKNSLKLLGVSAPEKM